VHVKNLENENGKIVGVREREYFTISIYQFKNFCVISPCKDRIKINFMIFVKIFHH